MADRLGCADLHRVAALEQEVYGEVLSGDAQRHVKVCDAHLRPLPVPESYETFRRWVGTFGTACATFGVLCVAAALLLLLLPLPVGILLVLLGLV